VDTGSKPPGGHHTSPGAARLQHHHCTVIAGRTPPCRRTPLAATASRIRLAPPSATAPSRSLLHHFTWWNPPYRQPPCSHCDPCHRFVSCPPGGSLAPSGAIPAAQCYWFLALKQILLDLKSHINQTPITFTIIHLYYIAQLQYTHLSHINKTILFIYTHHVVFQVLN